MCVTGTNHPPPPWNVDDVTRAMSKGCVCVFVNDQEWGCFSIFRRADDVTRTMSKGVCVLVNVFTRPSGNPVYPRLHVFHLSKFRPPPPHHHHHHHLDGWLRACNVTSKITGEAATIRQPEEHPGLLMAIC